MWVEQSAYNNRWRDVAPGAKALFALAGLAAAFVAPTPAVALALALVLALVALRGAGVRPSLYLRVLTPVLGFLSLSCASLLVAVDVNARGMPVLLWRPDLWPLAAMTASRALAALCALLGLVLSTPLVDLMALLRRLHMPEILLDLMVLCYRMLFVCGEALNDTWTAQAARLGHSTHRRWLRSMALLLANLAAQIWQRAQGLQIAANARNSDGALRFLSPRFAHARHELQVAAGAGLALLLGTALLRWVHP